ncbi:type II toxin-antitoxin system Rv0910 family toxin [Gordonia hydrophobica]|uniref:SRPBCC family protein n=1 Tax=Gordonia hydrophobica TaxID=40516 RepID=A0ABZ2TYY4_9ACTN|nr:SRPBCC family protein [Gordonia hydrophobica]MBM7365738.1 uncharacterized protein YndB with AHSA1/START domain [Gordonia hydrophobica]
MAKTVSSVVVALPPEAVFETLTDLSRFGEWLVFHDSWRGATPSRESLREGVSVSSVLEVKGATAPFDWTVDAYTPPSEFRFSGKEKGVKVRIVLAVRPAGSGSEVSFQLELGGLPMAGPVGKAVVKSLSDDVKTSVAQFGALVGA